MFWLALPSFGESWHNNHHAFPTSACHGLDRWQLDPSALVIRGWRPVARDALPERAFGVHDGGAVGVEAPSSRGARPAGLKRVRLCAGGRSSGG